MMPSTGRILAAIACCGVLFGGCSKKEEPPPPPPPPKPTYTPPPPEPVDVVALLQDVGADARVQFPKTSAPTDRDLAEGTIRVADAIARGDDETLRDHLTESGERVLDELIASGAWWGATDGIEAVRVVYVAGASNTAAAAPPTPQQDLASELGDVGEEALQFAQELASAMGQELSPADLQTAREEIKRQMQAIGDAELMEEHMQEIRQELIAARQFMSSAGGAGNRPLGQPSDMRADVVLAVQDASSSYLLGWKSEEGSAGMKFSNVAVSDGVRRFARDWDGATLAELAPRPLVSVADASLGDLDRLSLPDQDDADAPAGRDRNPNQKQTPRGPVNIPQPGGS